MGIKPAIREIAKRIAYGYRANSESYINHLREVGVTIGANCTVYVPTKTTIDETRPWMVTIGNNVSITEGVTILTHGWDASAFKGSTGRMLGSAGRVTIGDNVFIGMHSTILKGVRIGSNVVIGANSLISKDVPNGVVVAGNPARIICDIATYEKKRLECQIDEAFEVYDCWCDSFGDNTIPPKEIFREFFWLFELRGVNRFECEEFNRVMDLCGTAEQSWRLFNQTEPSFAGYHQFVDYLASRRRSSEASLCG